MADRELLSLNNLSEPASLQAELDAAGNGVRLHCVLAVPAARYGEFKAKRQALDAERDATKPWVAEMAWRTTVKPTAKGEPEVCSASIVWSSRMTRWRPNAAPRLAVTRSPN